MLVYFIAIVASCVYRLALCSGVQTFVIGEFPKRDTDRPRYKVHLPRVGDLATSFNPSDANIPSGFTSMRMVTARGQAMRCLIPKPEKRKRHSRQSSKKEENEKPSEETRFDDIDEILKVYENKCFVRKDGWWTFEFCYARHLVQKHVISNDQYPTDEEEVENVLGIYKADLDEQRRKNASLISMPDAPFTQEYIDGTICDLTGKPRRAIIKFICSDDALQMLQAGAGSGSSVNSKQNELNVLNNVREVESCVYEVEFLNSAVCHHATYKEKAANAVRPIHCSMEDDQDPFEGLDSAHHHRASLSL